MFWENASGDIVPISSVSKNPRFIRASGPTTLGTTIVWKALAKTKAASGGGIYRNFRFDFGPTGNVHLTASAGNAPAWFRVESLFGGGGREGEEHVPGIRYQVLGALRLEI
jgi:hypothetical protein